MKMLLLELSPSWCLVGNWNQYRTGQPVCHMEFQGTLQGGQDGTTTTRSPVGICIPGILVHENGSIDRSRFELSTPFVQASENESVQGVATKDVVIDDKLGIWIRIFLPKASSILEKQQQESKKIPIVLYFHPGGFVILNAGSKPCHELCCKIASRAQVMVVSVEYRKAPEHKLPAAFEDAANALKWLQAQAAAAADSNVNEAVEVEPWLLHYGDFSSCFLMGHSAGATIVHDLAYRASSGGEGLSLSAPLNVRGIISCIACFGGSQNTVSEMVYSERDSFLTMKCLYSFWRLALPEGADLDHPYANFKSSDAPTWENLRIPPVMMVVGEHDLMLDRQLEFAQMLKGSGINVTLVECKGRSHSEILFPEISGGEKKDTENAYLRLKEFMAMCSSCV